MKTERTAPALQPTLRADAVIGIVNRGEAAVRCIRAVREFNALEGTTLTTVAFYTAGEEDALFVQETERAFSLTELATRLVAEGHADGAAMGTASPYINKPLLHRALQRAGCTAVWVGWGFVSEDAEFAQLIEEAGIVFLGPDARAMALLGDKIEAKKLAAGAKVPILPWSEGPIATLAEARVCAETIGYPVIVKAAHAGGGRGIRFVRTPGELESQFRSAIEETKRVTGDEIVFIERLVVTGRHLEVQCLSDRHGEVRTFGVRDCSVQRRNQKIIEETPPPHLSSAQVAEIESAAQRLMREARYQSAGTVEFLYDVDRGEFSFMEVNTRLQVEHTITEELYGIDLVHGQLRVARGESIAALNGVPRGHVVEARLNAEDPDSGFTPAPGQVTLFAPPLGPGVRCDSGVHEGGTIPREFDSMIAKIICRGANRAEAFARLERALGELRIRIEGGTTNRAFLRRLIQTEGVRNGGVDTAFVERWIADGSGAGIDSPPGDRASDRWTEAVCAAAAYLHHKEMGAVELNVRGQLAAGGSPRALAPAQGTRVTLIAAAVRYELVVREVAPRQYHLTVTTAAGPQTAGFSYELRGAFATLVYAHRRLRVQIVERGDLLQCELDGIPYRVQVENSGVVRASSPAIVLTLHVEPGRCVAPGDLLLSLEAMKMEIPVVATEAGQVRQVLVKAGEQVAAAQELIRLEPGSGCADSEQSEDAATSGPAGAAKPTIPASFGTAVTAHFELLAAEFRAIFLGFDVVASDVLKPSTLPTELEKAARAIPDGQDRLAALFVEAIHAFVRVERLFAERSRGTVVGAARATSNPEQFAHWARRESDRSSGMAEPFLRELKQALELYGLRHESEIPTAIVVRIYQSRALLTRKQELLRHSLFALERLPVPATLTAGLSDALDAVAELVQSEERALADAAIHARYELIDRTQLADLREQKRENIGRLFGLLARYPKNEAVRERLYRYAIDAGHHVVPYLLRTALGGDAHALEILGRRLTRDREFREIRPLPFGAAALFRSGNPVVETVLVVAPADANDSVAAEVGRLFSSADTTVVREFLLLLGSSHSGGDPGAVAEAKLTQLATTVPSGTFSSIAVGVHHPTEDTVEFRTQFGTDDRTTNRDEGPRRISPRQYRELRMQRLARFNTRALYESDSCWVLAATAKENPKDERLFAFVDVPSARAELDADGRVRRMVAFEQVFMEAVYAMRAEQARRTRRLYWNRLIIRIHTPLQLTIEQVREYAARMNARIADLGLERLVVYTRRTVTGASAAAPPAIQETELLFENISGSGFTLTGRPPKDQPLEPMDSYVARVVRARQRDTVYPYEIVKMITRSGLPVSESLPKGDFEEFELDAADAAPGTLPADGPAAGAQPLPVSVRGRPYGQNTSSIVFGIITNYLPTHPKGLARVLILSDSTGDLGSLGEAECRRVIAALDLAAARELPVEWLPVSAGARIDMESGTENLDWTAATLRRIIEFTQNGGEINIIVSNVNVGAQSYWNAEATMLMHTNGLLIMTEEASMLLTGKKALDFSGSVSGENNVAIGGEARIMSPNGQAQIAVRTLYDAYSVLFRHYALSAPAPTADPTERDLGAHPYQDLLNQGFSTIGEIFSATHNPERKKPFDMRQVMRALVDTDADVIERWHLQRDAETAIVWHTRLGGRPIGLIGIESRPLTRFGQVPHDGPETWTGGTLFPQSSKKVARALNAFSGRLPVVVLANLSGFDGSPESLRNLQLEYGAEIGRAVVNFRGPITFVVTARYHGGAYVVFSKALNPNLHAVALEGSFASVIGGAPAAAVVFPGLIRQELVADPRIVAARAQLKAGQLDQRALDELTAEIQAEKQTEFAARFDAIHSVERARRVGSIDAILAVRELRPYLIARVSGSGVAG